ncbi:MAG: dethiobiotin synthase [Chitinophagaceae bacterium]|nr:dethiobiotin synthase [Chitinophagaceae bacterium]
MSNRFFITGTGTGIGKTVVSAILAEASGADYWKPVQAGFEEGTDSEWVSGIIFNKKTCVHKEAYKLKLAASPHLAAREENMVVDLDNIVSQIPSSDNLIIEGAGGLMAPLNETEFVVDLIRMMKVKVIIVSKNELGSINHSLLTASVCKQYNLDVAGWVFNGNYMNYEEEIVKWSGIPRLASIRHSPNIDRSFVAGEAVRLRKEFNLFS